MNEILIKQGKHAINKHNAQYDSKLPLHSYNLQKQREHATATLSPAERAKLIQIGNKFLNQNKLAEAKKIFTRTGYYDGLQRLARSYVEKGKMLEAYLIFRDIQSREKEIIEDAILASIRTLLQKQ